MADPTPPTTETQEAPASTGKARGSILSRLIVLLFLAAVVLMECLAAYFYLPDIGEAAAPTAPPTHETVAEPTASEEKSGNEGEQVEVDLGEFSVTAFQPRTNTSLRIEFHLYGAVAVHGEHEEKEFQELLDRNVHRFREQVIVIVRSAELSDLTDAGLGLIKRRILEKTNQILGKPLLKAVIVSDFSFIEQ